MSLKQFIPSIRYGNKLSPDELQGGGFSIGNGNIWYVSSTTTGAADTNGGKTPQYPFATLNGAVAAATASNGDVIVVLPKHAETITAAAGVAITKAGLTIVGVGFGRQRPVFTFTTSTSASFDVTAADTTIFNVVLVNGIDAQLAMINLTAADFSIFNSEFQTNAAATGTVAGILTAATATRMRVEGCNFLGPAVNSGTTTTAQIKHEAGIDYIIRGNTFKAKMTQAIVNVATVLGGVIDANIFVVGTGTVGITMAAASTPMITNNRFNVASGTTPITAAAGFVAGNIYSAAAGVTSTGQTGSTATVSTI